VSAVGEYLLQQVLSEPSRHTLGGHQTVIGEISDSCGQELNQSVRNSAEDSRRIAGGARPGGRDQFDDGRVWG